VSGGGSALFQEILSRIQTSLFSNREQEIQSRTRILKRLAFAIYSCGFDFFIPVLPGIQEKLIDSLKIINAPQVSAEVFVCLRILITRITPQNLTPFWPAILSGMMRIFLQSNNTKLFLSVLKFLDFVMMYRCDEFHVHQWIFLADTLPSKTTTFIPFVDQLQMLTVDGEPIPPSDIQVVMNGLRRPIITIQTAENPKELQHLAVLINRTANSRVFGAIDVDNVFTENLLEHDFLELDINVLKGRLPNSAASYINEDAIDDEPEIIPPESITTNTTDGAPPFEAPETPKLPGEASPTETPPDQELETQNQ